jgi:hypothetical protein
MLLEGFNVSDLGLDGRAAATEDLDFAILLEDTTLDTARGNGTTTGNREHFFNGHQEGLVQVTLGGRDPSVNGFEQLIDTLGTDVRAAVLESAQSGTEDDGGLLALETVGAKKLAHFQLNELQHLRVINGINLVDEHNKSLDTDLAGKQQVLTSLRPVL